MKRAIVVLALLISAVSLHWLYRSNNFAARIKVSGNIEVTDAEVGFKLAGIVASRAVSEGETIRRGQLIATLENEDIRDDVGLRESEVRAASAYLAELSAGYLPEEIAQTRAAVESLKAEAIKAQSEYERQKTLYDKKVSAVRDLEVSQAARDGLQAKVREQEAKLKLLEKGPRQERIDAARAQLERAEHALSIAKQRLGYTSIYSPSDGIVLSDHIEPGEFVSPGTPVVTIGDITHPWLRAYINETDLGKIRLGQQVQITTDTYPGKIYRGTVAFISSEAEFTPKNVQTEQERVKLVYRMKIDVENPKQELKPGMPADGVFTQ